MPHGTARKATGCALGLFLVFISSVAAQPTTDEMVDFGLRLLEAGQYEAALEAFGRASDQDPADPRPPYYLGATSNRIGDFNNALYYLDLAAQKNSTARDLQFETGWAQVRLGRYVEAIKSLTAYEKSNPGRGQTSEFLGRAYLGLKDYDTAEKYLKQAIERDPTLESTALMGLALVDRARGDSQAAAAKLDAAANATAEVYAPSRMLRDRVGGAIDRDALAQAGREKPWRLVFSAAAGYTDNVIAASDDVPLPADISGTETAFGRFSVLLSYDVLSREQDQLQVGYAFNADEYEGQFDSADYKGHYIYADYVRRLNDRWTGSLRVANDYIDIGGDSFRNALSVRPAATLALRPDLAIEFAYTMTVAEYFTPTTLATDRDGQTHNAGMTAFFQVPNTQLEGRLGVYFTINNAEGGDYDSNAFGVFASAKHPLVYEIDIEATYAHIETDYGNPNSFTGFILPRADSVDVVSVELSRPIDLPKLGESEARVFIRYDFTSNDSNIAVFDYDEHTVTGGVVVEF